MYKMPGAAAAFLILSSTTSAGSPPVPTSPPPDLSSYSRPDLSSHSRRRPPVPPSPPPDLSSYSRPDLSSHSRPDLSSHSRPDLSSHSRRRPPVPTMAEVPGFLRDLTTRAQANKGKIDWNTRVNGQHTRAISRLQTVGSDNKRAASGNSQVIGELQAEAAEARKLATTLVRGALLLHDDIGELQAEAEANEVVFEDAINRAKLNSNVAVAQAAKTEENAVGIKQNRAATVANAVRIKELKKGPWAAKKETASKKRVGSLEGRLNTALALGALRHNFSKDTNVSVAFSGGRQALGSTERPSFAAGVSAKMDNNTFVNLAVGSGLGDLSTAAVTFGASFSF